MERRDFLKIGVAATALADGAVAHAQTGAAPPLQDLRFVFSKGLPHDAVGRADASSLRSLLSALQSPTQAEGFTALERIDILREMRLVNPSAAWSWAQEPMSKAVALMPPPPLGDSQALADQALELYWMALCRDVTFTSYERDGLIKAAAAELSQTATYNGVTPETVFRLGLPGERGNYLSQMLIMPIPYGAQPWWQTYKMPFARRDFLTDPAEFAAVQSGAWPKDVLNHDSELRYLRTGRDLAEYVRWDFTVQPFLNAALIAFHEPHRPRGALSPSNPFKTAARQNPFVQFGLPHILALVSSAADLALKGAWAEKWLRHRFLRPEAYGGIVQRARSADEGEVFKRLLQTDAVRRTVSRFGSALLPQSYPEGAPLHPAYPSGHAVIAGACTTVLKAMFDPEYVLRFPIVPTFNGLDWAGYSGPPPKLGPELDKLACNVSMGRNFAGIHWRCDALEGLLFGERIGHALLAQEQVKLVGQGNFKGFRYPDFYGRMVNV